MSRFQSSFAKYAAADLVFQFGEPGVYFAGGVGGGRSIQGIVERDVQTITDAGIPALATFVTVKDSATAGISKTEIDTGSDTYSVALRQGETPQVRQIVFVESVEGGLVRFQVN